MENIQTDEETRPLASPRRRVAEAYSTNDRQNEMKKYSFWIFAFIAFLIFSMGSHSDSDKKKMREKKLRNKAETMPEVEVAKLSNANKKAELNDKYAQLNDVHAQFEDSEDTSMINDALLGEDDLDMELGRVHDGVELAEEFEIEANNSILSSAVKSMEESVKFYLGGLFGYGDEADDDDDTAMTETSSDIELSEEQLDAIAKKISERLDKDVKSDFKAKADSVKNEKVAEIDQVVAEDKDAQMSAVQIKADVKEAETVMMSDLKEEIDDAANQVKEEIPEKVKKIRNEVVEEMTGKKLDHIESKKRAKKEKRAELARKFKEMQARAREADKKESHSDDGPMKQRLNNESDDSKSARDSKQLNAKGGKYSIKKEKVKAKYSEDKPTGSEDNSPKSYSKVNEKLSVSKKNGKYHDESDDKPSDQEEDSEDKDKVVLSSGRRDEDASEDEEEDE